MTDRSQGETALGTGVRGSRWWRRSAIIGALVGLGALAWVLRGFDWHRFLATVADADMAFLLLVPAAIVAEQVVRGWKWRQLLHPIAPVGTLPLFGAIMAGYLSNLIVPLGFPVVRSWLVARREALQMSAVLATVTLDRLTDGIVFVGFVALAVGLVAFPDPRGDIRAGLIVGGAGSLGLFALLLFLLLGYRSAVRSQSGWLPRMLDRLPPGIAEPVHRVARSFAEGIVWPRAFSRSLGIVVSTIAMKLLAATHFLWAGLAFAVVLRPTEYIFLIAFLGFLVVLTHFARIAGGFITGSVFALSLFGVGEEEALAMALVVQGASLLCVAGIGALALWWNGVGLADLRAAGEEAGSG